METISNTSVRQTSTSVPCVVLGAAKVVDFAAFKARKSVTGERKTGLQNAFKAGSKDSKSPENDVDFAERIERIKASISRINSLMSELKGNPTQTSKLD